MVLTAGRPREFDTNEILDKAMEIFWRKGFSSTTTRELETELSLNQSSLYNSFGSKESFFYEVLNRYEHVSGKALIQPLENSADGAQSILTFFDDMLEWVSQDKRRGCLLINLMAEDGGSTETINNRTEKYRIRVRQALGKALKRAERKREISTGKTELRTNILFGLALGLNIAARGGSSLAELDDLLSAIQDQVRSWMI